MRGRRSHKTATEKAKQEEFFERAEYGMFYSSHRVQSYFHGEATHIQEREVFHPRDNETYG